MDCATFGDGQERTLPLLAEEKKGRFHFHSRTRADGATFRQRRPRSAEEGRTGQTAELSTREKKKEGSDCSPSRCVFHLPPDPLSGILPKSDFSVTISFTSLQIHSRESCQNLTVFHHDVSFTSLQIHSRESCQNQNVLRHDVFHLPPDPLSGIFPHYLPPPHPLPTFAKCPIDRRVS